MIATWMAYVLATSFLLTGAAAAAEALLRRRGRGSRGVWAAAAGASLVLAALPWLPAPPTDGGGVVLGAVRVIQPGTLAPGGLNLPALLGRLDTPLLALWLAGSLAALAALAVGAARLVRMRRRWRPAEVDGRRVLVSDDFGPALVGLLRPGVVLPRWVSEMPADARRMVLMHEEEHRRAGDVPLLLAVTLGAALLSWNAAVWLQLHRLRAAVEVDCDRRVLRRGAAPVPYAELLLRVGARRSALLTPALAEPARTLERRLEMILTPKTPLGRTAALALTGATVALVALACEAPAPSGLNAPDAPDAVGAEGADAALERAVESAGGEPLVIVDGVRRERSYLDALSKDAIDRIEVLKRGAALAAWGEAGRDGVIQVFTKSAPAGEARDEAAAAPDDEEGPHFTPFTVAPDILDRDAVIAAMGREYPPLLREAGIGGQVRIYFHLDRDGTVVETRVDRSSGHAALDAAALRVAPVYRFSPALNRDERVPVWISLPITFRPDRER